MSFSHTVKQGETLASIANEHEFRDWRRIWNHPDNAELRATRASPDLLSPGDTVVVPFKETKWVSCETNAAHTFVLDRPRRNVALTLLRGDQTPFAGCRYELSAGGETFEGVVPGSGRIEHPLASHDSAGTLRLWFAEDREPAEFEVLLGHLEPVDQPAGLLARLANLGYYHGPLDGSVESEDGQEAIAAFAKEHDVPAEDHARVCEAVVRVYGC